MKNLIKGQFELYPECKEQDLLKAVYQSVFGCGHFVYDEEKCRELLEKELETLSVFSKVKTEDLGRYSRVHLSALNELGISSDTLLKLFIRSAEKEDKNGEYIEKIKELPEICKEHFDKETFCRIIEEHIKKGCPSLHHSDRFRKEYSPAYRIISSEFADMIPLFSEIEKREEIVIAIDGKAASGKSSLATILFDIYGADIIHMDDYFLPPERKTAKRLNEAGGNVDHERFLSEVLLPLVNEGRYISRPYRCHGNYFEEATEKERSKITVIEGSYSLHPALYKHYDLKVFISASNEVQAKRIECRNPEMYNRFITEWIPLENRYFEETDIESRCDIKIVSKEDFRMEVINNEK